MSSGQLKNLFKDGDDNIGYLINKVLTKIEQIPDKDGDTIHFWTKCGKHYRMYHEQDYCEDVYVDDIVGDLQGLLGLVIDASCETNKGVGTQNETYTWTFYKIQGEKENVTIRWYGTSSGYYCEEVDFQEVTE